MSTTQLTEREIDGKIAAIISCRVRKMPHYAFYISDSRYSVPSLMLSSQPDAGGAKRLARQLLYNSPQHLAVDVYLDDEIVAHVDRDAGAASQ